MTYYYRQEVLYQMLNNTKIALSADCAALEVVYPTILAVSADCATLEAVLSTILEVWR